MKVEWSSSPAARTPSPSRARDPRPVAPSVDEVERVLDEPEPEPVADERRPVLGPWPALDRETGVDPEPDAHQLPRAVARWRERRTAATPRARGRRRPPRRRHRRVGGLGLDRRLEPDAPFDRLAGIAVDAGAQAGQHRDPGHRGVAGDGPDGDAQDVRLDPVPGHESRVATGHPQLA